MAVSAAVDAGKLASNPLAGIKRLPDARVERQGVAADEAERIRAELPTIRDQMLWGLLSAAGLCTEAAPALRRREVLGLSHAGCKIAVDRVFVAGEIRERTKTGLGPDVDVIRPLAEDLIALYEVKQPGSDDELVCASGRGTPVHLDNWRNHVFNPAASAAGVEWATPYTGRRTFITLQIHAGVSPVLVPAAVGHTAGETIWRHYARDFDRARTTESVPMEDAIRAARRRMRRSGLPSVFHHEKVVQLRPAPVVAYVPGKPSLSHARAAGFEPATFGSGG